MDKYLRGFKVIGTFFGTLRSDNAASSSLFMFPEFAPYPISSVRWDDNLGYVQALANGEEIKVLRSSRRGCYIYVKCDHENAFHYEELRVEEEDWPKMKYH